MGTNNIQRKPEGFKILSFGPEIVLAEYSGLMKAIASFKVDSNGEYDLEELKTARFALGQLNMRLSADAERPIYLKVEDGKINGLRQSLMSDILGITYGQHKPVWQMVKICHNVGAFSANWRVFGVGMADAEAAMRELKEKILRRICNAGIVLNGKRYGILAASADAQKKGEIMMGEASVMTATVDVREGMASFLDTLHRADTAAEWLKRMAVLLTPSTILTDGGSAQVRGLFIKAMLVGNGQPGPIRLDEMKIIPSIKTKRTFERVRTVDGKFHEVGPKELEITQADGMAVRLDDFELMEELFSREGVDILPEEFRGFKVLATTDVWKANKIFQSWKAFLDWVHELEPKYPFLPYLRCVRLASEPDEYDEEGNLVEEPETRELSRQLLQQMLLPTSRELAVLTRRSRRWLKRQKTFAGAYSMLTEAGLPEERRSDLAKVFAAIPELMGESHVNAYLESRWTAKRNNIARGKLRVSGSYPFLAQDPIAFMQVAIFGHDPEDPTIGCIGPEEFSLAGLEDGQEAVVNRYPANAITAKVLTNRVVKAFAKLEGVAVLSWHGDTIVRFDGDFDGDEALVVTWKWFVNLMKRQLAFANFPLIEFEHGSKEQPKPFGTRTNKMNQIAAALQRSQEYNQVGIYSDLAMTLLALASDAAYRREDAQKDEYLRAASLAHVGAILCIDQVKGNAISPDLLKALKVLQNWTRKRTNGLKPWNQQFHKPGRATMEEIHCTADRIASLVVADCGEWELEGAPVWLDQFAQLIMSETDDERAPFAAAVSHEFLTELNWANYCDSADSKLHQDILDGKKVGLKAVLLFFWRNKCALSFKMEGADVREQEEALFELARKVIMDTFTSVERKSRGRIMTVAEKEAVVVNTAIRDALELGTKSNGLDEDKKASYTMFVLRVFAKDIVKNIERNAPLRALRFVHLTEKDSMDMDFDEESLAL